MNNYFTLHLYTFPSDCMPALLPPYKTSSYRCLIGETQVLTGR